MLCFEEAKMLQYVLGFFGKKVKTPIFYQVDKPGCPTSYLFGVNHLANSQWCHYFPEASEGFKQATHLIYEIQPSDQELSNRFDMSLDKIFGKSEADTKVLMQLLTFYQNYPWNDLAESSLRREKETFLSLEELKKKTFPDVIKSLSIMIDIQLRKTFFMSLTLWCSFTSLRFHYNTYLMRKYLTKLNKPISSKMSSKTTIEKRLHEEAFSQDKKCIPLETKEEQQKIFEAGAGEQVDNKYLIYLVLKMKVTQILDLLQTSTKRAFLEIRSYLSAQYAVHLIDLKKELKMREAYNRQITSYPVLDKGKCEARNKNWLPSLRKLLEAHSCFVVVGLRHIADPQQENLQKLLTAQGFTVKPIFCPMIPMAETSSVIQSFSNLLVSLKLKSKVKDCDGQRVLETQEKTLTLLYQKQINRAENTQIPLVIAKAETEFNPRLSN